MSERAFRGVVAVVMVLALALAVVVVAATLYHPSPPLPSPSPVTTVTPAPSPTPAAGPAFDPPGVVSVGLVPRGSSSGETLVLEFVEPKVDAIPDAPGSFRVSLVDDAGATSTVAFIGQPRVAAPGSLGVTVVLAGPNVLQIDILASDTVNIESVTITGLGLRAAETAALGPVVARASDFSGSLAHGIASDVMASPGSVVETR